LAVALRDQLPFLDRLLQTGTITVEHAAAVRDGLRGLDGELVTDAADGLVALARCTDPVELRKRLRDKAHAIDDRLAAQVERRARARMGLRLSDVGSHTALDGTLPAEDGAMVRLAMDLAIEADRHDGDTRSKAARHADVLIRWATDSCTARTAPVTAWPTTRTPSAPTCTSCAAPTSSPRSPTTPATS
jgi:hypothetical protein